MTIRGKIFGVFVVGAMATVLSVVGGGAAHATQRANAVAAVSPGDIVNIRNVGSDMCAEPTGAGNGARVVQHPCVPGKDSQRWVLSQVANGVYEFFNVGTSNCMDVRNGVNADGTPIQQWACNGSKSMRWRASPSFNGVAQVLSETGGRCLDVFGGDGAPLRLIHCTGFGNLAQVWTFPLA